MLKASRYINFMWSFVGLLISNGYLVFFNIGLTASLVFTGQEGKIV